MNYISILKVVAHDCCLLSWTVLYSQQREFFSPCQWARVRFGESSGVPLGKSILLQEEVTSFSFSYIVSYSSSIFAPTLSWIWSLEPQTPSWVPVEDRELKAHTQWGWQSGKMGNTLALGGIVESWIILDLKPTLFVHYTTVAWDYKLSYCLSYFWSTTCFWKHPNW